MTLFLFQRIREEITMMKEYFMTCREASNQKLLRLLEERQHFVENSYMYSLEDLVDVQNGTLIKFLDGVYSQFVKHIREDCLVSLSNSSHFIFPFIESNLKFCFLRRFAEGKGLFAKYVRTWKKSFRLILQLINASSVKQSFILFAMQSVSHVQNVFERESGTCEWSGKMTKVFFSLPLLRKSLQNQHTKIIDNFLLFDAITVLVCTFFLNTKFGSVRIK